MCLSYLTNLQNNNLNNCRIYNNRIYTNYNFKYKLFQNIDCIQGYFHKQCIYIYKCVCCYINLFTNIDKMLVSRDMNIKVVNVSDSDYSPLTIISLTFYDVI